MKKTLFLFSILISQFAFAQTTADTISRLKEYSHHYLDLLFNKQDIDSAIGYWHPDLRERVKQTYRNQKGSCNSDSAMKKYFAADIQNFCKKVTGTISFEVFDDNEGINVSYHPFKDWHFFSICYHFYGEYVAHNRLMRSCLIFQSFDHGKTWSMTQDGWIQDFMILKYVDKLPDLK